MILGFVLGIRSSISAEVRFLNNCNYQPHPTTGAALLYTRKPSLTHRVGKGVFVYVIRSAELVLISDR